MKNKKTTSFTFRKLLLDFHLWIGIASSLVLFLVCLSGTIYTFRNELIEQIEPEKFQVESVLEQTISVDQLVSSTELQIKGKVSRIVISDNPKRSYELQVIKSKKDKRGEAFFVNQYSGKILGSGKSEAGAFFTFFFKMHRWLLFDQNIGRPIVGTATLLFVFLMISGGVLWFPKKIKGLKSFKMGFKIKFSGNWKRINRDLHTTLGFYILIFILIMALTGLCWSFEWYKDGASKVLGAKVFGVKEEKKIPSIVLGNAKTISLDEIIAIGNSVLDYQGPTTIQLPKNVEGSFEFSKRDCRNFNKYAQDRIILNQYSGIILKKELFSEKTFGEKIAGQIKAIHTGEIFGIFSKSIYFIVCLIATTLPITGIIIWINKLRKNSLKQ